MSTRSFLLKWKIVFLVSVLLATVMSGISLPATFDLTAGTVNKTLPDGSTVTMWGFGLSSGSITVPGPALVVNPADTTLTINLTNYLPVPVSIVIPGLTAAMSPTFVDTGTIPYSVVSTGSRAIGDVTSRVGSFTNETPANGTGTYTWTNVKPGTYLYQSGTNPAVQVQMGLYGMIKKDAANGAAYPENPYDVDVPLLFSEIDPVLVTAIANGNYINIPPSVPSPAPGPQVTSTIDYAPQYFLINGESYNPSTSVPTPAGDAGQNVLLRILNAGLRTHVPVLLGSYVKVIAEGANPYAYSKEQYSVILPAGKTIDAIFTPQTPGIYPVFDRRLDVSDASYPGGTYTIPEGGMITKLQVGGLIQAPTASSDSYSINKDTTLTVATPGVLGNDIGTEPLTASLVPGSGPLNGTLTLNANGSFEYVPNPGYSGPDTFQYMATNAGGTSVAATVSINVINNMPPEAVDQTVTTNEDTAVAITLAATDTEGNPLTYSIVTPPSNGTLTGTPPNMTYTPTANFNGVDTFTFKANDGSVYSNVAAVTISVTPVNDAPVAVDDYASTPKNTPIIINILANDYDVDGTINPATVAITTPQTFKGKVEIVTNGVLFTPKNNWKGTDVFKYTVQDELGLTSNIATVRVNVK